jgi:hypothetical protein
VAKPFPLSQLELPLSEKQIPRLLKIMKMDGIPKVPWSGP